MNEATQEKITEAFNLLAEEKGSQALAARLVGISKTVGNRLSKGKYDEISIPMWQKLFKYFGFGQGAWQIAQTAQYKKITQILRDSKDGAQVLAVVGDAGAGKTESITQFCKMNRNAFHVSCAEYFTPRTFLKELCYAIGLPPKGGIHELVENIISEIMEMESPIIILDEADKLANKVLYFFITFYNRLQRKCGVVLCSTAYLEKRINRGAEMQSKGFEEIKSRIGGKCVHIPQVSPQDIALVAMANGVTNKSYINKIIRTADGDLRRVERVIWAMEKQIQKDKEAFKEESRKQAQLTMKQQ